MLLRARTPDLVAAWRKYFAGVSNVQVDEGDIFGAEADAVISPANSFGFMDGGIDLAYSKRFGWHVQERLQKLLRDEWDGELPVGLAVIIPTDDPTLPYCISAPTMRAPANVATTLNAYVSFRAALRVIQKHNAEHPHSIQRCLCPGLCTGTGEMPAEISAKQMHAAWLEVEAGQPWVGDSINNIINEHYRLLRT